MHHCKTKENQISCMIEKQEHIAEVNDAFLSLTGYGKKALIGVPFIKVWTELLRINTEPFSLDEEAEAFLFTKTLEARSVVIRKYRNNAGNENVFEFTEKPDSRFEAILGYPLQLLAENKVGISIYSVPDLTLLKANQMYLDFFDTPNNRPENMFGKQMSSFLPDFYGSRIESILKEAIDIEKSVYQKEFCYDKLARGMTYWDQIITPVKLDGKVRYLVTNTQEATERVKNRVYLEEKNRKIKNQKEQLEKIMENLYDGVYVSDKDGKLIMINAEARKQLYEPDSIKAFGEVRKTSLYFDMEGREISKDQMPGFRALRGEKVKNCRLLIKQPDKELILDVNAVPIYNDEGELTNVAACSHDVTELVQKENTIVQKSKQLEAVIENIHDAMAIFDKEGRIIQLNAAAREMHSHLTRNKTATEVHSNYKYFDLEDRLVEKEFLPTQRALRGEKVRNESIVIKKPDKVQVVEINATPIFDRENNLDTVVVSHRDITESIKQQQDIKQQQELLLKKEIEKNVILQKTMEDMKTIAKLQELLAMKDKLGTAIIHDIRAPLAMLVTLTELLEDEFSIEDNENAELVQDVKKQIINAFLMVENMLEWFGYQLNGKSSKPMCLKLLDVVNNLYDMIKFQSKIKEIQIDIAVNENTVVFADKGMLEFVLRNLLTNAIKFTYPGGLVSISSYIKHDKVIVAVSDTGIGINIACFNESLKNKNLKSTTGTDGERGMGFGLNICREFVQHIGGDIWAESIPGKGSVFYVSLPAQQ